MNADAGAASSLADLFFDLREGLSAEPVGLLDRAVDLPAGVLVLGLIAVLTWLTIRRRSARRDR